MSYLADITWMQLILIEIGSLLQFLALCEFVRERNAYRVGRETREEVVDTRDQEQKMAEQAILLRAIHAGPMPVQSHDDDEQPTFRAADLVKTAKVKFKQSFKFRENE